uniref:Uncharacterized protein n=1 Tax=Kalanchoe fedtschenkoi TaxID=63787 RepID=A0A7N0TJG5_KALFE
MAKVAASVHTQSASPLTTLTKNGRRRGFTTKCASLVKEQQARIYILRRCATMLLCWYIQGDD